MFPRISRCNSPYYMAVSPPYLKHFIRLEFELPGYNDIDNAREPGHSYTNLCRVEDCETKGVDHTQRYIQQARRRAHYNVEITEISTNFTSYKSDATLCNTRLWRASFIHVFLLIFTIPDTEGIYNTLRGCALGPASPERPCGLRSPL